MIPQSFIAFMTFFLFFLSSSYVTPNAYADLQKIARIYSFDLEGEYAIYITTDSQNEIRSIHLGYIDAYGEIEFDQSVDFEELTQGKVLFHEYNGYKAVYLHCPKCTSYSGGQMDIIYLNNGVFSSYKTLSTYIRPEKDFSWRFSTKENNTRITKMTFEANTSFGKVIGIKKIRINDEKSNTFNHEFKMDFILQNFF